jgi:hypothetical protein
MKVIKQASIEMEVSEMEIPFPWYVKLIHSQKWQKEHVETLKFAGPATWNNIVLDFETTPFELGVAIDQIKIDDVVYQGVVPLTIDETNPTVVECKITSAELVTV